MRHVVCEYNSLISPIFIECREANLQFKFSCFPKGSVCASIGLNRSGEFIMRPMAANSASDCLPKYENENIDPENVEHFRNMFLCMGNEAQKANKLCDWRPGGAVLYCKRPDGPWIFSGVETLAESCNTQDGEEIERPALYTKIDFTSGNSKISFNNLIGSRPEVCASGEISYFNNFFT